MYKRILSVILILALSGGIASASDVKFTQPNPERSTSVPFVIPEELPCIDGSDNILANADGEMKINISEEKQESFQHQGEYIPKMDILPISELEIYNGGNIISSELSNEILTQNEDEISSTSLSTKIGSSLPVDSVHHMSQINSHDAFTLSNQVWKTNIIGDNIGEEYIDPMTGNLIVTETDLILPGVDGLNLNLSRYYSLAEAQVYNESVKLVTNPKTITLNDGDYIVTEEIYDIETEQTSTYYYPYSSYDDAMIRVNEIESRDNCNGRYIYTANCIPANDGDVVSLDYHYTSEHTSVGYQQMRNNLGVGWSWCFPSVQVIKENYMDVYETPSALYYHNGKGSVMEVGFDDNDYWFENYVGGDISFEFAGFPMNDICSSARIDYIVEESDGTKYYFGPHGEIRTIMDIYGNKIQFAYTRKDFYGASSMPIISSITDTVGRVCTFDYTKDSEMEYITITVTSPCESEKSLELKYEKELVGDIREAIQIKDNSGNKYVVEGDFISAEPVLTGFINTMGEKTHYFPVEQEGLKTYLQTVDFSYSDKTLDSDFVYKTGGYSSNLVYLLGNIVRPASNTCYEYEICERNLGHSGISQAYRVCERKDYPLIVNDNSDIITYEEKNVVEYEYFDDYTGYGLYFSIDDIEEDEYVTKTKEIRETSSITRTFRKKDGAVLLVIQEEEYNNPVGDNLYIRNYVESFSYKQPELIKTTYRNESGYIYDSYTYNEKSADANKTYGKPLMITKELDYNTVITEAREKYADMYTYDEDTAFLLTHSWYQNDNTKCIEKYTYDANQRLIKTEMADGTVTTYEYEYTDGHVSKITSTRENDLGTYVIEEIYTQETAYAFPSSVTEKVSASGDIQINTTTYTYDMLLGKVKTLADNDGNVTYYEYDDCGRIIETRYPKYTTYSSLDDKDIIVWPVKNEKYYYGWEPYDGESSNLWKGVWAAESEITYYDATEWDSSYVPDGSTNSDYILHYEHNSEIYLGTGEIIRNITKDVLSVDDFASGSATPLITEYNYDTSLGIVSETDTAGSTVTYQYDGLGRLVKTIDEFDNEHIMEYNITGSGVGFKSKNYFVPSSNTVSKENVTEYEYDRWGRVKTEKGYMSYPDLFSEIEYYYDNTDNITGIIDANGNLNSDGYTVSNVYDKRNRLISSKNANDEIITNTYDNFGNIKKQTIKGRDGIENILYQRTYDGSGNLLQDTDNFANSTVYEYNTKGELIHITDKDNRETMNEYNELGTLDRQVNVISGLRVTINTNKIVCPHGPTRVFQMAGSSNRESNAYVPDDWQETQYVYSRLGKILQSRTDYSYPTNYANVKLNPLIQYSYDVSGNVIKVMCATLNSYYGEGFGLNTHYEYDKSRLTRVQIDGSDTKNTTENNSVRYEYYDDGKIKKVTYPALTDGSILKTEYEYDGQSRLKRLKNYKGSEILSGYEYTYDNNNNIVTVNEIVGETEHITNYTYDKLNRIASVSGTKGADSYYEYDARGNRKVNFEETDFLSETSACYAYDENNNLTTALNGTDTTNMEYSSKGYRYVKQVNTTYPTYYIYDESGRLIVEPKAVYFTKDGKQNIGLYPANMYIWAQDKVLAKLDALHGEIYYYLYNGHGDVVQIVDTSGTIINEYDYDVWGNFLKKEGTIENPFTYFGQTYDETTGLYYLRARYYDPTTGRFTQQDPAEDGYNWYVYCVHNPVAYVDDTGLRTYVLNGINNGKPEGSPNDINSLVNTLEAKGVTNVSAIGVYNGTNVLTGMGQVAMEMINNGKYADGVAQQILTDLENNPLASGEQLNLVGYSGGGQIALNVAEKLSGKATVSNTVLIGAPVIEATLNNTGKVVSIWAGWDPLSWNVGWGVTFRFAGWFGHTSYFNSANMDNVANIINEYID